MPISHFLGITAFCLYVLAQGYHGVSERTEGTVEGHSIFWNFSYGKRISNKLLYKKRLFQTVENIDLIPSNHGNRKPWSSMVILYQLGVHRKG